MEVPTVNQARSALATAYRRKAGDVEISQAKVDLVVAKLLAILAKDLGHEVKND